MGRDDAEVEDIKYQDEVDLIRQNLIKDSEHISSQNETGRCQADSFGRPGLVGFQDRYRP